MDATELIAHAAASEAKSLRPAREAWEVVEDKVPYFSIKRNGSNGYAVTGHNHVGHDNESRMDFVCAFLRRSVLPYIDRRIDVSGFYKLELHDSYSYLDAADSYANCLTFSRRIRDSHMTLLPNPYQMANYAGQVEVDTVPWDKKTDLAYFAGSTTGARDPDANVRVQACRWALGHRGSLDFKLTHVVQMSMDDLKRKVPEWQSIVASPVPIAENFNHKYLVNLPGNTCAWSRVPLVMASKSLLLNVRQSDIEWFYPFMIEGTHFLGGDLESVPDKRRFAASNPQLAHYIVANANRFAATFLGSSQAALYTACLLEEVASRTRP